jgi:hypothetical protein
MVPRAQRTASRPGPPVRVDPGPCPAGERAPVRVDTVGAVWTPGRTLRRALGEAGGCWLSAQASMTRTRADGACPRRTHR